MNKDLENIKEQLEEVIKKNLPEKEEYTGFCDKTGTKIYSGDWLEFISQWEGEQIWVGQVIFEDGVWTVDITNKKIIKHSKKWSEEHPDRDWTNTRAWACDVGYGEYGSWNDRRKSISEIAGYFKSSDEMFKVRDLFNNKYGKFHSNDNLQRELPVLIVKGEKKESDYRKHSTGFNQALSQINPSLITDEVLKITKCDCCDEKDEHIFKDDRSTTRISRPCSGCGKHQTIAGALLKSKEWEKWYKYASENMLFDVDETLTVDAMSDEHWNSFMKFLNDEVLKVVVEKIKEEREIAIKQLAYETDVEVVEYLKGKENLSNDLLNLLTNSSTLEGERSEHLSPNKENKN